MGGVVCFSSASAYLKKNLLIVKGVASGRSFPPFEESGAVVDYFVFFTCVLIERLVPE